MPLPYADRTEAGRSLARAVRDRLGRPQDAVVLALPRGGVPVGYEVARTLDVPLDVFMVRKLGVPGHEELAMGAIASGTPPVLNQQVIDELGLTRAQIDREVEHELEELRRREARYRNGTPAEPLEGRTAILVDDGLATGATMRAAVRALRLVSPRSVVVAVPVAAVDTCEELQAEADEVICARTPQPFYAVGMWYRTFTQTTDDEVRELLDRSRSALPAGDRS